MEKQFILDEIRRTAEENGGLALGSARFEQETGVRRYDWMGKHWARWGDALREAGFAPKTLNQPFPDDDVLVKLALVVRELGRLPTNNELRLRRRRDVLIPSHNVFARLAPTKAQLAGRLATFCEQRGDFEDVVAICNQYATPTTPLPAVEEVPFTGVVYLMKSGRNYKIGRSNSVGRRAYELQIQLPDRLTVVHAIRTDDPDGIERYWQQRFAAKRGNGEWFKLDASDVNTFRRRKFM